MLHSEIAQRNAQFAAQRLAVSFIKAREAVVKCKYESMLAELKAKAKDAKNNLAFFIAATGVDIKSDDVIENFCGFGREWKPSEAAVSAAAIEHQITHDQAREMLEASLVQAQLHSQTQRANLAGIYAGWLADVDPDNATESKEAMAIVEGVILDAYKRAGEWMRRDEGILIEGDAEEVGMLLPKWADMLPKVSKATTAAKEHIQRNLEKRAQQATEEYINAMKDIDNDEW